MKHILSYAKIGIFLLALSSVSCLRNTEDHSVIRSGKYRESVKKAYQSLGTFYVTNSMPGLSVAVSIDNQIVWADAIGYSNLEFKVKASPEHKFRIGQVSEVITALTAAKLSEEGQLDIEKPVADYLPEIDPGFPKYTIHQLANHTSGIRTDENEPGHGKENTLQKVVSGFIGDKLIFYPGTWFIHTELGIDLLGYVIEKTQKEPFTRVVKKTLLDTLHLNSTVPDNPFRIVPERCSMYDFDFISQPIISNQIDLRGKEPSAGYLSNATDLVKLGNLFLYPGFLKQETIDMMLKPYQLPTGEIGNYGFGIIVSADKLNETFYGARGSVNGGSATLLIYPKDKMVIALLANIGSSTADLPIFDIAKIFKDQLHPEEAKKEADPEKPANTTSGK